MGRDSLKFNVCMKQWNSVWSQERWCWWTMMNLRNHVENIWGIMLSGGNIFLLLICMITLRGEEADKRDCSLIIFHWPLTIGYILIIFHWHWRLIVFWLYSINHSPLIIFLFKTGLKLYSIDNCPLIIFWLYSIDNWPAIVMVWL